MGLPTVKKLREGQQPDHVGLIGLIRRVAVGATKATGIWQLLGYTDPESGERERFPDVPVFGGIGFASRPRAGKGEAIVVHVGSATGHPIVVATRDRETQVELEADETAIFTSKARVIVKADGTVHVDDGSGAAALATKADLDALLTAITGAAVVAGDGGAALKANILAALGPAWPAGTTVLRSK